MKFKIIIFCLTITKIICWENLTKIPSGRQSQYYILEENGAYKHGYETSDGLGAAQAGDKNNEVTGRYFYKTPTGQNFDLKYTSGKRGFLPEILKKVQHFAPVTSQTNLDEESSGDASYSFNIDTDTYKRQEDSDSRGNVRGSYSYSNEAGTHDLTYIAGENTGFVATSGSLSVPNGLKSQQIKLSSPFSSSTNQNNPDGSYSYGYSTVDSSQQVSADLNNNVQGRYSYRNKAGVHDLSYVASAKTGFLPSGGSLSQPKAGSLSTNPSTISSDTEANTDGSYSFTIDTDEYKRQESGDPQGNIQGSFSYKNKAGNHDLSFVAGSATGFQPIGGSLRTPPGLNDNQLKSFGKNSYNEENGVLHSYLPPIQANYGNVFDSI